MTTFAPPIPDMKVQSFGYLDEAPEGPWTGEPDKAQWVDAATGLDCLIVRHSGHGALCGYVGVPFEHKYHGADFPDVPNVDVHDGLSYSALCQEMDPEHGICHIAEPGRPENVWWFGFAGRGTWDYAPLYEQRMAELTKDMPIFAGMPRVFDPAADYRDFGFMYEQTTGLARQLLALA